MMKNLSRPHPHPQKEKESDFEHVHVLPNVTEVTEFLPKSGSRAQVVATLPPVQVRALPCVSPGPHVPGTGRGQPQCWS